MKRVAFLEMHLRAWNEIHLLAIDKYACVKITQAFQDGLPSFQDCEAIISITEGEFHCKSFASQIICWLLRLHELKPTAS